MRMGIPATFTIGALSLLSLAQPGTAHHSFSVVFDVNKAFKMTGKVTQVEWKNPHVYIYIDVADESGAVTNWAMELGSPNNLIRAGWSRNSLPVGAQITVEGSLARDGSPTGAPRRVIAADGRSLFTIGQ